MQNRLMVLGSMSEFVELVKLAKGRGIYTIACDGYPEGPAKRFADKSYDIDVRDTQAIADVCTREGVDAVITSFSDLMAECMVNIAAKAGLACYATPEKFRYLRDKSLMKAMLVELGAKVPRSALVHRDSIASDMSAVGFPCVIKPVDGYGSKGVYLLNDVRDVEQMFDETASCSTSDCILAESFISGHEFNMMNWIVDGEVVTLSVADRETSPKEPKSIPDVSRCAYPSRLIDKVIDGAREIVAKVADYVGITNGPLSMQFFYSEGEGITVCEVAGRLFGYEHELVKLAGGPSIEEILLDFVYDREALKTRLSNHTPFFETCSAGLYFHGREGVISSFAPAEEALGQAGVVESLYFYEIGDEISHGPGSMPYALRVYITARNRDELDELTYDLFRRVQFLDCEGKNLLYEKVLTRYDD